MKKVDLNQVLELLINEDADAASALLHEWFVGMSKNIHESLMQEEDEILENDRLNDIENDKDAIEAEEFYGEGDLSEEGDEGEDIGGEEAADDMAPPAGDEVAGDEFGGDEAGVEEVPVEDKVEDLEAKLAELKAEFEKLMGGDTAGEEVAGDEFVGDDDGVEEVPADESFAFEGKEEDGEDDAEDLDEDFQDLEESFELEPVKDPGLTAGKEIGAKGDKFTVNDTSPIPQKKGPDRVGGKAVEIKAKEHKGYEREAAPAVKDKPLLKNQVKTHDADLTGVSKEGDKSAMLNKKDGFGSDSPKSPIGAGAADLRGSDLKRK